MKYSLLVAPAGTVVSTDRGMYRHVGLLTENGRVLSINPGRLNTQITEESQYEFGRGRPLKVDALTGRFPSAFVLARARSGSHPAYSWTQFNCEHFVRLCHGLAVESPQLARFALALGAGLLYAAAVAKA